MILGNKPLILLAIYLVNTLIDCIEAGNRPMTVGLGTFGTKTMIVESLRSEAKKDFLWLLLHPDSQSPKHF